MKRSLWITLALLICAAVTMVSATHTSLAYIAARSNTVRNSFRVVYQPAQDISVPILVHKTMRNLSMENVGLGGYQFHLVDAETGESFVATSADDGWAAIYMTYTAEDAGRTYRYRLYELNDGRRGVTFDETVYEISITLSLDERHELVAQLTLDGQPVAEIVAEYENVYYASVPLPDTGDHSRPALWAVMMILSGAGLVLMRKNRIVFGRK